MATKETAKKVGEHAARKPAVHHAAKAASHAHVAPVAISKERYIEAVGRRKTAIARVRIMVGHGKFLVNGKELKDYFYLPRLLVVVTSPLEQLKLTKDFDVSVNVSGGGINAQAEAIRHGLAQTIVIKDLAWKPRLRAMGFLTRDSRMVERKKYGLKKARRAPQWAKR